MNIRRVLVRGSCACLLTTVVLASAVAAEQGAPDLGRLFFDSRERAELDRRRLQPPPRPAPAPRLDAPAPVEVPAGPPPDVTMNGYVVRESGRTTTWINDQPVTDQFRIRDGTPIAVPFDDGRKRVPLKPGQTYGQDTGTRDGLAGGKIEIRRQ